MRKLIGFSSALVLVTAGCALGNPSEREFSKEWINVHERDAEFRAREERIDKGDLVLLGRKGKEGPVLKLDENGKTQFRLGGLSGFHADLDLSHMEPDFKVRYRWEW